MQFYKNGLKCDSNTIILRNEMYFYWTTVEIYLAMNSILAKRLSIVILVKQI